MYFGLPPALCWLLVSGPFISAYRLPAHPHWTAGLAPLLSNSLVQAPSLSERSNDTDAASSDTAVVWTIDDNYAGQTFFDGFDFYTGADPTHGTVNYTTKDFAFANNLAYVQSDGTVIMKGDNTTTLPVNVNRNSVRVSSTKQYNTGLFILDLNQAPWGCGVWPAWWTLGGGQWPYTGEIDIIEGVHDNEHNQVTWHTGPNCTLNPNATFTGAIVETNGQPNLVCDGLANGNSGCGVTEWSRASYGPTFDAQGGGVFAMKWDEDGIAVWSFYRAAVPQDIVSSQPDPSNWGTPVAVLEPSGCDPISNFINHSIVFDITFCGDWAGNSYATSGCPGTCTTQLQDPGNFDNAIWNINTLKVYKKVTLTRPATSAASSRTAVVFNGMLWLCVSTLLGAGILL
ncbi:hypothetical protein NM688_g8288 [Phlebia brevispora]|uniref:Uncharacterized protein n=1 Tax=Phlebia brevispora TaxID=194682 RepID=A0ACC1RT10_9APHY|nr:hypothetical protein NM688_g8288 [Phlebia brevispora]